MSGTSQKAIDELFWDLIQLETPEAQEDFLREQDQFEPETAALLRDLLQQTPAASNMFAALDDPNHTLSLSNDEAAGSRGVADEPAAQSAAEFSPGEPAVVLSSGTVIGPYKLLEPIGEGGMGIVYLAQQSAPVRRKVAIKIIKPGMDSRQVVARFEAERQALAMMEHPNIAKVLEAGTTIGGLPFFVMELVKGIPITEYCDRARMPNPQRLTLFCDACNAIQHAHNKGVIHRDIKPSNVLVTELDGRAIFKVIDFGVAKALTDNLTDKTLFTGMFLLMGTPLYMSPEQAGLSNIDVDVRSDVYSLGVMLYELLSGTLPLDREEVRNLSFDQLQKKICETEPPLPSKKFSTLRNDLETIAERRGVSAKQVHRLLLGELDWIVMKAIEKDRKRRYQSARELAEDIERYLTGEEVEACPPSAKYRLRKYVQRNKAILTTLSVIGLTMLLGTIISLNLALDSEQALELAKEESKNALAAMADAETNLMSALDAVERLLGHATGPQLANLPGGQALQKEVLEDVLQFYSQLQGSIKESAALKARASETWMSLARLSTSLGELKVAETAFKKALKLSDSLQTDASPQLKYVLLHIDNEIQFGQWYRYRRNDTDNAKVHLDRADHGLSHLKPSAGDAARRDELAMRIQCGLAKHARYAGDSHGEIEHAGMAYEIWGRLPQLRRLNNWAVVRIYAEALAEANPMEAAEAFLQLLQIKNELKGVKSRKPLQAEYWILHTTVEFFSGHDPQFVAELAPDYIATAVARVIDYPSFVTHEQQLENFAKNISEWSRLAAVDAETRKTVWKRVSFELDRPEVRQRTELLNLQWELAYALDRSEDAFQALRSAFELDEQRQVAGMHRFRRSEIFQREGDHARALADFNASFDEKTESWQFKRRALAHFYLGNFKESVSDLQTALDKNPADNSSLYWIPEEQLAACTDESFQDALLQLAERHAQAEPGDPTRLVTYGHLLTTFGRTEDAVVVLEAAKEAEPNNTDHCYRRAVALLQLERWDEAIEDLLFLRDAEPNWYRPSYCTALAYLKLQDTSSYRAVCEQMVSAPYTSTDSEVLTAAYYVVWTATLHSQALTNYAAVIESAQQAVDRKPENKRYLVTFGAICFRSGDFVSAQRHLVNAAKLDKNQNNTEAYRLYFLALTEAALMNIDAARQTLKLARQVSEPELEGHPKWNRRVTLELLDTEAEAMLSVGTCLAPSSDGGSTADFQVSFDARSFQLENELRQSGQDRLTNEDNRLSQKDQHDGDLPSSD